jgi:hypothetical protein
LIWWRISVVEDLGRQALHAVQADVGFFQEIPIVVVRVRPVFPRNLASFRQFADAQVLQPEPQFGPSNGEALFRVVIATPGLIQLPQVDGRLPGGGDDTPEGVNRLALALLARPIEIREPRSDVGENLPK